MRNQNRWNRAVAAAAAAYRRDADMSQQQVAELIGCSRNTIVRIESGRRAMTVPELMEFAKAVKATPASIMDFIVRWHR
jgi:DNA-binding XRE family transcriptional regulator